MARRSPPREQWRAIQHLAWRNRTSSGFAKVEGILAARSVFSKGRERMRAPIIFTLGTRLFEIRCDPELGFVGYLDGEPTVAAGEAYAVARALINRRACAGFTRRLPSLGARPDLLSFAFGADELDPVG